MAAPLSFATCIWLAHEARNGREQMAMDEALFRGLDEQRLGLDPEMTPILVVRTYQWTPATWSLGRFQKHSEPLSRLMGEDPVVRRPTGGRAIFHNGDLSFAFISNHPQLLAMSVSASYCVFQKPLKEALIALHIPLQGCSGDTPEKPAYQTADLCFDTHLPQELVTDSGDKVCGMAQARRKASILQHGAAFLSPWDIHPEAFESALKAQLQQSLALEAIKVRQLKDWPELYRLWQSVLDSDYALSGASDNI